MTYNINVGNEEKEITITETASRELNIDGNVYVVPVSLVHFIEDLAAEVRDQQKRRVATDQTIDSRIHKRVDQIIKALASHGLLAADLQSEYTLPAGMETDSGSWTFFDEARQVAHNGLKKTSREDLVETIGRG